MPIADSRQPIALIPMKPEDENAVFEQLLMRSGRISLSSLLRVIASRWYWVAGSAATALLAGYLAAHVIAPEYEASLLLKFPEKQSELDDLKDKIPTLAFWRAPKEYLAEKYHIAAPGLLLETLENLNAGFSFRSIEGLRETDVYPFRPLVLRVLHFEDDLYQDGYFETDGKMRLHYIPDSGRFSYPLVKGSLITVPGLSFTIDDIPAAPGLRYKFTFDLHSRKARLLAGSVGFTEAEENLPVMRLSFRHHNEAFTKDFLRLLAETYREHSLLRKQASSDLTLRFIAGQKAAFADSLQNTAHDLELFRQNNQLYDISTSATHIGTQLRGLEQEKYKLEVQGSFIGLLEKHLAPADTGYLPEGPDTSPDAVLPALIGQFNRNISRREELTRKYAETADPIQTLDNEIRRLRKRIADNVGLQKQQTEDALRLLESSIQAHKDRFGQIPGLEKTFLHLQSKSEVNRNIYLLLLDKEMEVSLLKAGILPPFTLLSPAEVRPLFPKQEDLVVLSLFFGVITGIGLIFFKRNVNRNFSSVDIPDRHPGVRISGLLHRFRPALTSRGRDLPFLTAYRDLFTEEINALRTRLLFSRSNLTALAPGRLIMITSGQSGEGKSFITISLALSFARTGKKVLVIGCDLRRPETDRYFGENMPSYGLSEWLNEEKDGVGNLIRTSQIRGLDYIPGGIPPPLPGELLQKKQFYELLEYVSVRYDYILLDTAPVGLVADNIPLLRLCDHVVYLIRWLYSKADAHEPAIQLASEYGIPRIMVVINDFYTDHLYDSLTGPTARFPRQSYYYRDYSSADKAYLQNSRSR